MPPLIIYHRGRHGRMDDGSELAENSLAAFARAVAEGAEMVELDVWANLQVAHDPHMQLFPKLPEILELLAGQCAVNIEVKSPLVIEEVVTLLRRALASGHWSPDQFVLSAFHHQTAIDCKRRLPELRVGAVIEAVCLPEYIRTLHAQGIDQLHIGWANLHMDAEAGGELLRLCRELNMPIWVWTVNTLEAFKIACACGAEAVFTDEPVLLNAFNASESLSNTTTAMEHLPLQALRQAAPEDPF